MADTVVRRFLETAKRNPTRTAVRFKQGSGWLDLSWSEYLKLVASLTAGLQVSGLRKGDRIAILSNTRLEWAALDLAALSLGAIAVPIYPSSTVDDVRYILQDSQAKFFFVENEMTLLKCNPILRELAHPPTLILIDAKHEASHKRLHETPSIETLIDGNVETLDVVQKRGEKALEASPALFELSVQEVGAGDVATLIYTSGTTGRPKGVVLTHTQLLSEVAEAFPLMGVNSHDTTLTFLPFAHVLGRIEIWGHAVIGYTMAMAESIDRLKDNLPAIQPTVIVAVPRIFEKIHAGILAQADVSQLKRKAFDWALAVGAKVSACKQEKRAIPLDLALQYAAASKLVFDSIRARLGGKLRFAVCGGAPLNRQVAEFFHAAGILILEGYGLTETTAAICVNTPFDYRFGTVGKPIGEVKVKIADDGEILVKSKKVMRDYYRDAAATAAVMTDGWFHTGDIGELDESGHLRITDRKKDLIKTAGGKYVAPQRLEGFVKLSPIISNVHIHGDQRKYCVALATLSPERLRAWAKENGFESARLDELISHPKVRELVRKAMAEANSHLAPFETIKNFAILPNDFTVESGELTPSLKVKRKVVDERYKGLIDSLYT